MKTIVTLLILFALFSLNTFAQDYTQLSLPKGAKARLGKGTINDIAYSPDGTRLAVAGSAGILLYDTATYQEVALLTGHTGHVTSIAFSPGGSTIAGGSWDDTVRLWNVRTGALIRTFIGETASFNNPLAVTSVAFSPDGSTIAIGGQDRNVRLWEFPPSTTITPQVKGDVNGDGVVNILDLVFVSSRFGQAGPNQADVNDDRAVNILDLVAVAGVFSAEVAAPALHPQAVTMLTAAEVKAWLAQAQQMALTTPDYLRGIAVLKQLLATLIPKETVLLPNYPNPFNPETWIPYRLAHDAEVTLTVYDTKGVLVRRLDIGHQAAGYYTTRSKAAYWDGRNHAGESVASGMYFYQLWVENSRSETGAGDFSATRRLLILK